MYILNTRWPEFRSWISIVDFENLYLALTICSRFPVNIIFVQKRCRNYGVTFCGIKQPLKIAGHDPKTRYMTLKRRLS